VSAAVLFDRLEAAARVLGGQPQPMDVAEVFGGEASQIGRNVFVEGSALGDVQVVVKESGEVSHVRIDPPEPLELASIESAVGAPGSRRPGGEHGAPSTLVLFEFGGGAGARVTLICHVRRTRVTALELRRDPSAKPASRAPRAPRRS
jgi:hypothetical protein